MRSVFKLPLITLVLAGMFVFANTHNIVNAAAFSFCSWVNGMTYGPSSGTSGFMAPEFAIGNTLTITNTGTVPATIDAPVGVPVAVIPPGGSATFTIKTTGVTSLFIHNYAGTGTVAGSITCSETPPAAAAADPSVEVLFNPGDGRINHHVADRAAPAAVYCQYEGVQVFRIDPVTADGTDEIRLTAADIEGAGVPAEGNIILAQTEWAIVARLADGRFSLNTWYADGKPYTIIWGECDLADIEYAAR